ncbi:MAG: McrC family protein [Clostridiales Family XIII bacterium]|jgi:5-methylcytosine-specific restriction endonuclease McrBC regulatory subunit McrC|nr:McrC family protein [Clostridiales Family XIII bacterium]
MMILNDNSSVNDEAAQSEIVKDLVGISLAKLSQDDFIIFPQNLNDSVDLDDSNYIFESSNYNVKTCNVVGLLKKGNDEIRITSRFYETVGDSSDYFLRYLLQKVMNYNVISNKVNLSEEKAYYDLLVYLFPVYLSSAMEKGIYKEYVKKQYNDANIKGAIDIVRHIKSNIPFSGKVAYGTREFSLENKITQLIRHTIEKLELEYNFDFHSDENLKGNVREIKQVTNNYSRIERLDVLQENIINPVRHGYFEEYHQLQHLCIKILQENEVGFANENDEVNGIIIDVAWLWEEYIATLLTDFTHPKSNESIYCDGGKGHVRPDFYNEQIVIDTKYKHCEGSIKREDRFQIISYLHYRNATKAGIVYPSSESILKSEGKLKGMGGEIFKLSFKVPQRIESYDAFDSKMQESEEDFISKLKEL